MMNITYRKFRLTIEALEPIFLPVYKGSAFRGGFGNAFRKILCALKKRECNDCILRTSCIYAYVFETLPHNGTDLMNMGKYERVPHPFIIEPPEESTREYEPGERVSFSLCLVGRAIEFLPYFIVTFEELGNIGLGRGRGKYALVNVITRVKGEEQAVYSSRERTVRQVLPEQIVLPADPGEQRSLAGPNRDRQNTTLRFLTPARVIYQRRFVDTLEFHVLIRHLLRRLQSLNYFHCGKEAASWDHRRFISDAQDVRTIENTLNWHDWERYSTRQKRRMKMGGLIGEISYGGNIDPFMSLLKAGEIFHVGKGTSFGLGRYVISRNNKEPPKKKASA